MLLKAAEDVYEFKEGSAGCLIGPLLIAWGVIRILHIPLLGFHILSPATWVDFLLPAIGLASFWLPSRTFLSVNRKDQTVTVYYPHEEVIPFSQVAALDVSNPTRTHLNKNDTHDTQKTTLYMKLKDGRKLTVKRNNMGYESTVRTAWNIEMLMGVNGSTEIDEEGVPPSEELAKMLKIMDDMYKARTFFTPWVRK